MAVDEAKSAEENLRGPLSMQPLLLPSLKVSARTGSGTGAKVEEEAIPVGEVKAEEEVYHETEVNPKAGKVMEKVNPGQTVAVEQTLKSESIPILLRSLLTAVRSARSLIVIQRRRRCPVQ